MGTIVAIFVTFLTSTLINVPVSEALIPADSNQETTIYSEQEEMNNTQSIAITDIGGL